MTVQVSERSVHGLKLTHVRAEYADSATRYGTGDDNVVRMHFELHGRYRANYPTLGQRYARLGQHCSLFYASPFELEYVNETPQLETFGVKFPVAQFVAYADGVNARVSRFCEQISAGRSGMLIEPSDSLDTSMELSIRSMLACRYDGALEQLYLLSQSLELLVRVLDRGASDTAALPPKTERDKLFAARELVDARLDQPPQLAEIARHVGLNEYKLKRGFKALFGTTVFAYLTAQRLELARRLLLDTDKTAAEVALELGYTTPQHFSQAFKQRFGVPPKSIRKST